ncbi:MAG: hypothetical protein HRT58_21905 [Crocinitomicaceae bacterium]|nr:hypothetical protein [Flavobacteriales bacterium]NQZ38330.1 hypothetical protein [Crocinitomicaceae bacterium]
MHDTRIGRFFAVDPLAPKYSYNSPYAFSENRVIDAIELEGLEQVTVHLLNDAGNWVVVRVYTDNALTQDIDKYNYVAHGKTTTTVVKLLGGRIRLQFQGKPTNAGIEKVIKPDPSRGFLQKVGEFAMGMQDGGVEALNRHVEGVKENVTNPAAIVTDTYDAVSGINARINNLAHVPNVQDAITGSNYAEQDRDALKASGEQLSKATRNPYQGGKFTGDVVIESGIIVGGVFTGQFSLVAKLKWKGPVDYSDIIDHRSVGPGKSYTAAQKAKILAKNRLENGGILRSDADGTILDQPVQSKSGVKANMNQAEVDHKIARSNDGPNSSQNAQVLSKDQNIKKSNN